MRRPILILCALLSVAGIATADEGMWLFNVPPTAQLKSKYGFDLTKAWLQHTQLSSVRFNNGGSGSFVSPDGLTFTNHHVGSECIQQLSTGGKDYLKTGFHAKTQAEEAKCPDLELNVLEDIEDVTAKVNAAVKPGMSVADQGQAQRAAMSTIEQQCAIETKLRCDVITLYSGAMYHLYKYKKYTDVRLVFAPEFDAAFFGGDPDNFEYPRYDLDVCFFRVYENDKPAHLDNYLKWSAAGVKDGDLIFVSGNPGSTGRLNTMAQLEFLRDTGYPLVLYRLARRDALLKKFGAESDENARIAHEDLFSVENSLKAIRGYNSGLVDKVLMDKKSAEEGKMRQAIASDVTKKAEFGDPWAEIAKAMDTEKQIYLPLTYFERRGGFSGDLASFARILVRAAEERPKPNGDRLREYRDSALPSLEQDLFSSAPIYKSLERTELADSLAEMKEKMLDNTVVNRVLAGKTPADLAQYLIDNTKLEDVAVRKQLYEGGKAAIDASSDPLIKVMQEIEPEARAVRKRYDDEIDAVVRQDGAAVAKIRFATEGTASYPDATFTLRLSYGVMRGYTENGEGTTPKGTKLPYFTTFRGAFQHAADHGKKDPYKLADSWTNAKSKIKLDTPLNAVETADIIGGNSGSPVINRAGELVGIIFDGNIQSLPWNFAYDDSIGRSIHVDSRGILEALRDVYGADALADELTGKPYQSAHSERSSANGSKIRKSPPAY
ncbi:MAG: serine protease [Acidobacteria bacterium]|nr:MAG: serine protease [Acidobacteriota bacterium]